MAAKNTKYPVIALWNPTWTIIWSLIFSPVFGAFLQRTNWIEMGEEDKATQSGIWVALGLIFLGGYLFAEPFLPDDNDFSQYYFLICWVVFYCLWLILDGRLQVSAVSARYGEDYHHKLWGKPLMLGAGGLLIWTAISLTYIVGLLMMGIIKVDA